AALDRAKDAVNTLTESAKSGFGFTEATTAADTLATAIGVGLYDAVKEAAGWMYDLGKQAFDTVADFERTTQSITAMIGIEKSMGTTVEHVSKGIRELTKKEIADLGKKQTALLKNHVAQDGLAASLKKLREADTEGKGNSNIDLQTRLLANAQEEAVKLGEESANLQGLAGQEFDIITKEQVGTIDDMKEAFRLAKPEADAILDSLTRLALVSPFERAPILQTMKQAQAFGFTSKEAMDMTEVFLKFATVTGRTQGHIGRLGYAMGQMKSQGKVMTRQLRQMNMAGLGMDQMAQAMGMSIIDFTAAVSKGKIPFDEFNANLTKFIDAKYTPAFDEINESFYGLQNAFK
ncbi:MAG: tape measure protein, partial [Akkermansiaceae bacterium]|nr:tape measure protein [Akkermansiaceae bacterium]